MLLKLNLISNQPLHLLKLNEVDMEQLFFSLILCFLKVTPDVLSYPAI